LKKYFLPLTIIFSVLALDQSIKIWVKLSFYYTQHKEISSWFYLYFIENEGMAFGITWGGEFGKIALTLFRIIASGFIWYWLYRLIRSKSHWGMITCVSLIFAGAIGNIIDSIFYGAIFSESKINMLASIFPEQGYGALLHGKVVDMFYFPLWEGFLPNWVPLWGGDYFIFFQPIFNLADASISIGVISILVFQKWILKDENSSLEKNVSAGDVKESTSDSDKVEIQ
jgi:signal peptidase II